MDTEQILETAQRQAGEEKPSNNQPEKKEPLKGREAHDAIKDIMANAGVLPEEKPTKTFEKPIPAPKNTEEAVTEQYEQLNTAVTQIEDMYKKGEISPEQYQMALINAQNMSTKLTNSKLNIREQNLKRQEQQARFDSQVDIPGWNDKNKREQIKGNLKMFMKAQYGMDNQALDHLAANIDPTSLSMLYDLYKAKSGRYPKSLGKKNKQPKEHPILARARELHGKRRRTYGKR